MGLGSLFRRKDKPGRPKQVTDADFQAEVLESEIPAVVDFWASWCAPCQVMGGLLEEIGPDYAGKINIFKLNIDRNRGTATKFGVMSIPTLIMFRNGKPVERIVGLMPLRPLRQKLERLIA